MAPNRIALGLVGAGMICVAAAQTGVGFEMFLTGIAKLTPLVTSGKPENMVAGEPRA
jgi:hypothetical protein